MRDEDEPTWLGYHLNDEDRWAVLVAVRADYGGRFSFAEVRELIRRVERELLVDRDGSRIDWRVQLADAVKARL